MFILFIGCHEKQKVKKQRITSPLTSSEKILKNIKVPEGFHVEIFADKLSDPRTLKPGPEGVVFFGNRSKKSVYALKDFNGDLYPDSLYRVISNLQAPNGIVFKDGDLFIAETSQISVIPDISDKLGSLVEPLLISDDMPSRYMHGWRYMDVGPDGKLYVAVGAPCDRCDGGEEYSHIFRINTDGSGKEIIAKGIRNSVGFAWHPHTGELWFSDNGSDELGDSVPPDEINKWDTQQSHFGYPYKYGANSFDPTHDPPQLNFSDPEFELPAHVAPLGLHFYKGNMFPKQYKHQLFVCEHGSRVLKNKRGYRISLLELDSNSRVVKYSVFAEGWLNSENQKIHGRPVDIMELTDGSLLVSDDFANVIYRIWYGK